MRFRIVTVCTANVCRSPLAEALLADRLAPARFDVSSAGTRASEGVQADPQTIAALRARGLTPVDHRAQQLTPSLLASAGLVLTATRDHRREVLEVDPAALRRTFTLMEFAALADRVDAADPAELVREAAIIRSAGPRDVDIADPVGRDDAFHRAIAEQIDTSVAAISERLNRLPGSAGRAS